MGGIELGNPCGSSTLTYVEAIRGEEIERRRTMVVIHPSTLTKLDRRLEMTEARGEPFEVVVRSA
jgi:hypothetical protein